MKKFIIMNQACKRNLPFLEFSYMIKLHMLKLTKPTLQMKQIHNSEKGKTPDKTKAQNKNLWQEKVYFYRYLWWFNTAKWATIHIHM